MTGTFSRRRKASAATVAGTLLAIVAFTAVNALSNGAFEYYDGNTTNEGGVAGTDWDSVVAGTSGFTATSVTPDPDYRSEATLFTGGSKDINEIQGGWFWRTVGQAPDKTDLLHALSAYDQAQEQLYFAADRYATNGDAKVGFWFLQDDVAPMPDGTFSGHHMVGDIMIESTFTNGGKIDEIKVYEWTAAGLVPAASISGGDCTDSGAASYDVCATNNQTTTTPGWSYTGKFAPNYKPGAFIEGAIDLTALYGANVPCFGTFVAETRSSGSSITSELKDLVMANFDTCASITIQKVRSGGSADTLFDFTTGGTLTPDRFSLKGADSLATVGAANKQTFVHLEAGTYSVRELALTEPWVLTNIICSGGTTATDGTTQSVTITAAAGQQVTCTFYNLYNVVTTRTQGFWSTHPSIAATVWGTSRTMCGKTVGTSTSAGQDQLMGGFWSNVATLQNGTKRSALSKAKMTLLQQLLAAMLNRDKFGTTPAMSAKIDNALSVFCTSTNQGAVNTAAGEMGAYNQSGDSGIWSPSQPADPSAAQARADIHFWDYLQ